MLIKRLFLKMTSMLLLCLAFWSCNAQESADKDDTAKTPVATPGAPSIDAKTEEPSATSAAPESSVADKKNLVANPKLEMKDGQDIPDGVEIVKQDFFVTKTEPNSDGGNALIVVKQGPNADNFYHVNTEIPIVAGKNYQVGCSYKVSDDFQAGKIGVQVEFLPRQGRSAPVATMGPVAKGDWQKVTLNTTAPQGAQVMRIVFPRIIDFEAGSITAKDLFAYSVE